MNDFTFDFGTLIDNCRDILDSLLVMWDSVINFLLTDVSLSIPGTDISWSMDTSWFELCFGSAVVVILTYAIVKFFTDILL